jgi:hypothetical protein
MIKNKIYLNILLIIILILITFITLDIKNIFSKKKSSKPEDLMFLEFIIHKYFSDNKFKSPKFYFSPYEVGIHTLLPGFRLYNFRSDSDFLIKNKNNLIEYKENKFENYLYIDILKNSNVHGIFFSVEDLSKDFIFSVNGSFFKIELKNLIECKELLKKKNIFTNNAEKSKNDIQQLNNCYYYEFNYNNKRVSVKFNLKNKLTSQNIKNIYLYGNDLEINPYQILEVSEDNYNFFFAKRL